MDHALNTLVGATTSNLIQQGIPAALTGPLVRADFNTLQAHLTALETADPAAAQLYRTLARLSLPMLAERGLNTQDFENFLDRM